MVVDGAAAFPGFGRAAIGGGGMAAGGGCVAPTSERPRRKWKAPAAEPCQGRALAARSRWMPKRVSSFFLVFCATPELGSLVALAFNCYFLKK